MDPPALWLPRPGEVSLAHYGVLFLDELPELTALGANAPSPKILRKSANSQQPDRDTRRRLDMADRGNGLRISQYWQDRAREARTLAYLVRDQAAAKDGIGRAARMYEDFAKRAVKGEDAEVAAACRANEPHPGRQ